MSSSLRRTFEGKTSQAYWSWRKIREYLHDKYGGSYAEKELRDMEVKWRRLCAQAGWSVKGE